MSVGLKNYAFVIAPGEHALLSASSADRWLTCLGSVALSKGLPNHSSEFAAEGTAAHWIAAYCQRPTVPRSPLWQNGRLSFKSPYVWQGRTALVEGYDIELDEELIDAVQEFLTYIMDNEEPGDVAFVEQSFTPAMQRLDPDFGGSTDRVMWRARSRLLRVYDYKHGAGIPVDVDDNRQLKYYALGALLSNPQWDAEDVELVIAQPRCDHEQGRIRTYPMKAIDLVDYAGELVEGAAKTREFGADLVPSRKACKFCPAMKANKCPAVERESHAIIAQAVSVIDPKAYSPEQIAEFLTKAPLVEARISAMREFAYQESLRGEKFPGWKVVAKRPMRKWIDEAVAAAVLEEQVEGADVYKPMKLKSPKQIEDAVGKKAFKMYDALVIKESSGMTLAPESDPRPPAQVAQLEQFKDVSQG